MPYGWIGCPFLSLRYHDGLAKKELEESGERFEKCPCPETPGFGWSNPGFGWDLYIYFCFWSLKRGKQWFLHGFWLWDFFKSDSGLAAWTSFGHTITLYLAWFLETASMLKHWDPSCIQVFQVGSPSDGGSGTTGQRRRQHLKGATHVEICKSRWFAPADLPSRATGMRLDHSTCI